MAMTRVIHRKTLAGTVCGTVRVLLALLGRSAPIILWANKIVARLNQIRITMKVPIIL